MPGSTAHLSFHSCALTPSSLFNPHKPEISPSELIYLEKICPSQEETWFTRRIGENSPWNGWLHIIAQLKISLRILWELPQQLRRLLGELERGHLEVGMHPEAFEPLVRRFEQLINRIVLGIIAASFINGLAVLLLVYHPFVGVWWLGLLFIIGFIIAAVLGIYLAWSILRSRRK